MTFETNECALRTAAGELIARGFVREHVGDSMTIDIPAVGTQWLRVGDSAYLEVIDSGRGVVTFRGTVEAMGGSRMWLVGLHPESVRQRRSAVRVPTNHVVPIVAREVDGLDEPLDSPWQVTMVDLSANGMRFLHDEPLELGSRWRVVLRPSRAELRLLVEVLRSEEVRGAFAHDCRISGTSQAEQDALFRWVLELQRVLLARRVDRR